MRILLRLCLHLLFALFAVFLTSPNSLATQTAALPTKSALPAVFSSVTMTTIKESVLRSGGGIGSSVVRRGPVKAFRVPLSGIPTHNCGIYVETARTLAARGADNVADGLRLNKSLASQSQLGEAGTIIAGTGSRVPFRDASRVAQQYGGSQGGWVKKTSSAYTARDGTNFETHWLENIHTGQRVEFKTVLSSKRSSKGSN